MNQERLNELKKELMNMLFIALSKLTDKQARENVKQTSVDLLAIIDAEIARQSVTDEDVARAIDELNNPRVEDVNVDDRGSSEWVELTPEFNNALDLAITALSAYRKPTAEEVESIDRAIAEIIGTNYGECQIHRESLETAITALRRMKGSE